MNGARSIGGDAQLAEREAKPVAEFRYAVQAQGDGIIRFNEIHTDPCAVGDLWLVCGTEESSLVSKYLTDGTPSALPRAGARLDAHRS